MEFIKNFFDFILHIDKHLVEYTAHYGVWIYAILFLIIFTETGLVILPFLPGDSLLFAVGALAGMGSLNIISVLFLLILAAFIGNVVNYFIGKYFGEKILIKYSNIIKKEYIDKTHEFYEKHGVKALVFGRFLPIIRTFVPFVAGIGKMNTSTFILWTFLSSLIWVLPLTLAGYFFGGLDIVKNNFSKIVIGIIVLSLVPTVFAILKEKFNSK